MIDRGDVIGQSFVAAISTAARALVMVDFEHKADSLITQNSKKRAERSERLMYEQNHRDYLRSGYLHHRLPVMVLIITVITPLPTKAQRDKNARELKLANAAITDMQMRQRDICTLDAKYTEVS